MRKGQQIWKNWTKWVEKVKNVKKEKIVPGIAHPARASAQPRARALFTRAELRARGSAQQPSNAFLTHFSRAAAPMTSCWRHWWPQHVHYTFFIFFLFFLTFFYSFFLSILTYKYPSSIHFKAHLKTTLLSSFFLSFLSFWVFLSFFLSF